MNLFDKIKTSWWVILSFIVFLNGLGFIYIGFKHNNRNWVLEGITYEIPWVVYFIFFAVYKMTAPTQTVMSLALILMLVAVIRSIWVAIKLVDVYENNEKYTIKQTNLNNAQVNQNRGNDSTSVGCCLCLICIFILFLIMAL